MKKYTTYLLNAWFRVTFLPKCRHGQLANYLMTVIGQPLLHNFPCSSLNFAQRTLYLRYCRARLDVFSCADVIRCFKICFIRVARCPKSKQLCLFLTSGNPEPKFKSHLCKTIPVPYYPILFWPCIQRDRAICFRPDLKKICIFVFVPCNTSPYLEKSPIVPFRDEQKAETQ